jgi:hypothetical protein
MGNKNRFWQRSLDVDLRFLTPKQRYAELRVLATKERGNRTFFENEYLRLLDDDRIYNFRVEADSTVSFDAVITHRQLKRLYFLAVYSVWIEGLLPWIRHQRLGTVAERPNLKIRLNVTGRKDKQFPHYLLREGCFCFGTRTHYLLELLEKGEIFQYIALVLDSMAHLNSGHAFASDYIRVPDDLDEVMSSSKDLNRILLNKAQRLKESKS